MRIAGRLSPEEFWARIAVGEQRIRDSAATLPTYGVADWPRLLMVGDWGWEDSLLVTVGLAHGVATGDGPAVHVRTTVHDPRSAVASLRMASAGAPHDKSDLLRRREAAVAPSDQIDVLVDFAPVRFEVCNDGDDRWLAAAEHTGYGLIVESRRTTVDSLALVRVHDVEPYLAGRRANLRARRGAA